MAGASSISSTQSFIGAWDHQGNSDFFTLSELSTPLPQDPGASGSSASQSSLTSSQSVSRTLARQAITVKVGGKDFSISHLEDGDRNEVARLIGEIYDIVKVSQEDAKCAASLRAEHIVVWKNPPAETIYDPKTDLDKGNYKVKFDRIREIILGAKKKDPNEPPKQPTTTPTDLDAEKDLDEVDPKDDKGGASGVDDKAKVKGTTDPDNEEDDAEGSDDEDTTTKSSTPPISTPPSSPPKDRKKVGPDAAEEERVPPAQKGSREDKTFTPTSPSSVSEEEEPAATSPLGDESDDDDMVVKTGKRKPGSADAGSKADTSFIGGDKSLFIHKNKGKVETDASHWVKVSPAEKEKIDPLKKRFSPEAGPDDDRWLDDAREYIEAAKKTGKKHDDILKDLADGDNDLLESLRKLFPEVAEDNAGGGAADPKTVKGKPKEESAATKKDKADQKLADLKNAKGNSEAYNTLLQGIKEALKIDIGKGNPKQQIMNAKDFLNKLDGLSLTHDENNKVGHKVIINILEPFKIEYQDTKNHLQVQSETKGTTTKEPSMTHVTKTMEIYSKLLDAVCALHVATEPKKPTGPSPAGSGAAAGAADPSAGSVKAKAKIWERTS